MVSCACGKLPMYSLNARDLFNCSPLLFSWPAPWNRCGQTERYTIDLWVVVPFQELCYEETVQLGFIIPLLSKSISSAYWHCCYTVSNPPPHPYLQLTTSEVWCWSGGRWIMKKTVLLQYCVLFIMVHKGTSSSYMSVDCIRLWCCFFTAVF